MAPDGAIFTSRGLLERCRHSEAVAAQRHLSPRRPATCGLRPAGRPLGVPYKISLLVVNATEMFLSFCYTLGVLDESRELRITHSIYYMYEIQEVFPMTKEKQMFCFQCEQTAMGTGCTGCAGVCGKSAVEAGLQDVLTGALVGLARTCQTAAPTAKTYRTILEACSRPLPTSTSTRRRPRL